jgi:hypothetical protein
MQESYEADINFFVQNSVRKAPRVDVAAIARPSVFPAIGACSAGTGDLSQSVKTTLQCIGRTFTNTRRKMVKNEQKRKGISSVHAC